MALQMYFDAFNKIWELLDLQDIHTCIYVCKHWRDLYEAASRSYIEEAKQIIGERDSGSKMIKLLHIPVYSYYIDAFIHCDQLYEHTSISKAITSENYCNLVTYQSPCDGIIASITLYVMKIPYNITIHQISYPLYAVLTCIRCHCKVALPHVTPDMLYNNVCSYINNIKCMKNDLLLSVCVAIYESNNCSPRCSRTQ